MRREGHRCILSRYMETAYYDSVRDSADVAEPRIAGRLELCHIFSESTNAGLEFDKKESVSQPGRSQMSTI